MSEPYVDANSTVEMLVEISRGVVITVDKGFVYQDATQQQPNA